MHWRHATGRLSLDRAADSRASSTSRPTASATAGARRRSTTRAGSSTRWSPTARTSSTSAASRRGRRARRRSRADEELRRVIPVIEAVAADHPDTPISVDTVKARVADAGAGRRRVDRQRRLGLSSRPGDGDRLCARRSGGGPHAFARRRCRHGDVRAREYGDEPSARSSTSCAHASTAAERGGSRRAHRRRSGHRLLEARLSIRSRCSAGCARVVGARLSGAGRRVAQAVHRRDHGRAGPPTRVPGTIGGERRGARARRAAVSRARRAADAAGARRRVGDHAAAGCNEHSRTAPTAASRAGATSSRSRSSASRSIACCCSCTARARCRCWSGSSCSRSRTASRIC